MWPLMRESFDKFKSSFKKLKAPAKRTGLFLILAVYGCAMALFCGLAAASHDMPSAKTLWESNRPVSVQIVDRYGRDVLVRGASSAPRVHLSDLPLYVPSAFMATEDKRFHTHVGIDPYGFTRAMWTNIKAGRYVQGGSTITQQLTKNVFLTPEKTIKRKVQEMMLSIWLEQNFTKDEILEMYLSRVYFGSGAWGLEAASQRFLGKSAAALNVNEAAMMAGLLKAPSRYNPVNQTERTAARTATILNLMAAQNIITYESHKEALLAPISIRRPQSDNSAQYFVDWIWPALEASIGTPTSDIVVQTTLDFEAQLAANTAVNAHINPARNASQAALVSLDGTGGVIAMIGGQSYTQSQFNRAAQAQRQPGSAFKPFVYLSAFKEGLDPWSEREDNAVKIGDWEPQNFNEDFKGRMSLERAFASSVNTVAVSLGEEIGRERIIQTAADFGLTGLKPLRSIALGAQVTTPLALTNSYLPFSNYGKMTPAYGILSVSTADGTPLYDRPAPVMEKVLSPAVLGHMNRLMTRTVEIGTARRAQIQDWQVAGKTGTTNDFRDAWFVGYAPDIVTGVWVGADDNSPMDNVTGGTIPTQIWQDYMRAALAGQPKSRLSVSQQPMRRSRKTILDSLLNDIEDALP